MKTIRNYKLLSNVVGTTANTPYVGIVKNSKKPVFASFKTFGSRVKLVDDIDNSYFKPDWFYFLKMSANGNGDLLINSGYTNCDGFNVPDWSEYFVRQSKSDTIIDNIQYYAFYNEENIETIYLSQDLSDKPKNEHMSVNYYYIEGGDITYDSEESGDYIDIVVDKYDAKYTEPIQETMAYTACENKEVGCRQEVLKIFANNNKTLTMIEIPDTVKAIEDYAFYGCTNLASMIIPDSITEIGLMGLYNCSSLSSLAIPESVKSIGKAAFYGCSSLTSVTYNGIECIYTTSGYTVNKPNVYKTNTRYVGIPSLNFDDYISSQKTDEIVSEIEISGTSISTNAFSGCTSLTSVIVPDTVTTIGENAFVSCSNLENITLSNNITTIGNNTFQYCSSLSSVTIPDSVISLGSNVFENCTSLTSVTLSESLKCLGNNTFRGCTGLTSVVIPDSVTSLGYATFLGCTSLTAVTFPSGITNLGTAVLRGCSSLESVVIPNGVTNIGNSAFLDCSSLSSITIPDTVVLIDSFAFSGCTSLETIDLPNSVTTINNNAFAYTPALKQIVIPEGCTILATRVIGFCKSLTSLTIPSTITTIAEYAIQGCTSLTTINYNGTVEQWNAITKETSWHVGVPNSTVITCTNGTVELD